MTLLVGNSETGFTSAKSTAAKVARAFAFTASETGLLEELQFRTNGTANTGVTSVRLGVFTDEGGKPGNVIQEGSVSGAPATNSWVTVTGLTIPVLKNASYWLVVLSLGGSLHYNAHGAGGTSNWRLANREREKLFEFPETAWEAASAEGPVGFQGLGKAGVGTERKITFGIDAGKTDHGHTEWTAHHVKLGRGTPGLDVEYTEAATTVSTAVGEALTAGIVPLVIINTPDSTVLSSITAATYAEKAAAIIKKVTEQHSSVRTFEIINEPYAKGPHSKSNASDYAKILKATYEKVAAEGITEVTLLAATVGTYEKVNAEGVPTGVFSDIHQGEGWVHDLLNAETSLKEGGANAITGWTSHPYGKPVEINNEFSSGFLTAVAIRETVKRYGGGGYNNWWITEVGFNTGGSGPSHVASEAEQSERLLEDLKQAQLLGEAGWLKALVVYADNGETWNVFGKTYETFANEHGVI
jgi:hypothetical protein